MLFKIYTDHHIPLEVVRQLRRKGVDVVRCEDVGLANAPDIEHLEYATSEGRAVVTHDADFLRRHDEWRAAGKPHGGIIFVQSHLQGKIGSLVTALLEYHELLESGAGTVAEDIQNQRIFIK